MRRYLDEGIAVVPIVYLLMLEETLYSGLPNWMMAAICVVLPLGGIFLDGALGVLLGHKAVMACSSPIVRFVGVQ
jgi:hypothetical protein